MTLRIALACLVTLTAAAAAEPAKKDGPGVMTAKCKAEGTPLFEKNHTTKTGKGDTEVWKVYESGALTKTVKREKEAEPTCLTGPQLEDAKSHIAKSPWKITTAHIHCMAVTDELTIYSVRGKEVFREYVCSGRSLDDVSQKTLDLMNGLIQRL